jgi:hypothetical protein
MEISTELKSVNASKKDLYTFLSEASNFEHIMPENTSEFNVIDENAFKFGLKGMPEIVLKFEERTPNERIILGSTNEQFPFQLKVTIGGTDVQSALSLNFSGSFNPMISMMIKSPLTSFMETLSSKTIHYFAT